eukprot:c28055_g2_i1 orf=436-897(+)
MDAEESDYELALKLQMEEMCLEMERKKSGLIHERYPGDAKVESECFDRQRVLWMPREIEKERIRRSDVFPAAGKAELRMNSRFPERETEEVRMPKVRLSSASFEPEDFDHHRMNWMSLKSGQQEVRVPKVRVSAASLESADFDHHRMKWMNAK